MWCNCCPQLTNFDENIPGFQQIGSVKLSPYKKVKVIEIFIFILRRETFSFSNLNSLSIDLIFVYGYLRQRLHKELADLTLA